MRSPNVLLAAASLAVVVVVAGQAGRAHAQIDRPGAHSTYKAEIEPHLVVQWDEEPVFEDEGLGIGLRASIPLVDNGPVTSINNSLAVTFGLDWAHFDDPCLVNRSGIVGPLANELGDCSANDFWLPIAAQWNFFFSDLISSFVELGIGLQHSVWDVTGTCGGEICQFDESDTDVELVVWLGVRFHLSRAFALTLRLGRPSLLLGAAFFM